jgi:subtilisin family serine protease
MAAAVSLIAFADAANAQPTLGKSSRWIDFISDRAKPQVGTPTFAEGTPATDRVVRLSLDPAKLAVYRGRQFTEGLIATFEDISVPIAANESVTQAIERACYGGKENKAYWEALEGRLTSGGVPFVPSDASSGAPAAIRDRNTAQLIAGWVTVPYCIPQLPPTATYGVVSVPGPTTYLDMHWDKSWAAKTKVLTTGEVRLSDMLTYSEAVYSANTKPINSYVQIPRVYSLMIDDLNIGVKPASKLARPADIKVKGASVEPDRTALVQYLGVQAVARAGISPEQVSYMKKNTASMTAINPSAFVAPLAQETADRYCQPPLEVDYGRDAAIKEALQLNKRFRRGEVTHVKVLVADTGIVSASKSRFAKEIRLTPNLVAWSQAYPQLYAEHGSRVMSLTAGYWLLPDTQELFASDLSLIPINVFRTLGNHATSVDQGLREALADGGGVNIANLSVKYDDDMKFVENHPSTLFVVAAGNEGGDIFGKKIYPADNGASPNVIAVAALESHGLLRAGFSNGAGLPTPGALPTDTTPDSPLISTNEMVSLAAPGCRVRSVAQNLDATERVDSASGTSFAAPLVTFAAMLIAREGGSPASMIKARLLATADRVASITGVRQGRRLNVERAIGVWFDQLKTSSGVKPVFGRAELISEDGSPVPGDQPAFFCAADEPNLERRNTSLIPENIVRITGEYIRPSGPNGEGEEVVQDRLVRLWSVDDKRTVRESTCEKLSTDIYVQMRDETGAALGERVPLSIVRDLTFVFSPDFRSASN